MKHRSVQLDYQAGNEMINAYHRKKNHQQVLQYKSMIQDEDSKIEENNSRIKKMNKHMNSLEKSIHKKQKKLKEVLDEIH